MDSKNIFPRSLQYLIAVAEHGSFTHAAETLYVSQPSLSQQIKKLEDSLQTTLLNRSGRTVQLTDSGKIYLHHANRAWMELDAGMRGVHDVKDLKRGMLRLGFTPINDYLTCCLVKNFNEKYPNIVLNTLEMPQNEIELAITEGHIDAGIIFSSKLPNTVRSNQLETCALFEESICIVVSNKHPLAKEKEITVKELGQKPLALLNTSFVLRKYTDLYFHEHNIFPHIVFETNSLNTIIEVTQAGSFATILPKSIALIKNNKLHAVDLSPKLPQKVVSLISRKNGYKSFACLSFIKLTLNWVDYRHKKLT